MATERPMRVLVLALQYAPDGGPGAPLYAMLCEELARAGHDVTVVCAAPHYPSGQVPRAYRSLWARTSVEAGVRVIRVPVPSVRRSSLVLRMVQFAAFQIGAVLPFLTRPADVLIVGNPAIETGLPFLTRSALRHTPAIYSVHDVYPDVGINLGIFKNPLARWVVEALERACLERAAVVRILADSFAPAMERLGVPAGKLHLVHDWVDTELIRPLPRENELAKELDLDKGFVVMYAGNLGLSQALDTVIDAAQLLQTDSTCQFVLAGDGPEREHLQERARGLENVRFVPFQPRERLPELLASADVSLVTLRSGVASDSLPSKSFSIFASGRPLLAAVEEGSDTWNLVQRAGAGMCVPAGSAGALAAAVQELKANPDARQRYGNNGRSYALAHHSPGAAAQRFEEFFGLLTRPSSA